MSTSISLSLDGFALDGARAGTSNTAVRDDFKWPTAAPKREWIEKRFGDVQVPNPQVPHFELEVPLQFEGTDDEIAADAGTIAAKCAKAEAFAHIGGVDLTAQISDAATSTTLTVLAGDMSDVQIDRNRLGGYGAATLKLYCEPWLLGPWSTVKTGRTATGAPATEVQIGSLSGDIPGPARITVTNNGSVGQQFAMLGLDGRGYASGNKLVLSADTFDVSTAPLNGTYTAGTNEVQTATTSGTISGGTFTLTFEGATTSALAYNASTATVQTALEGLSTVGTGNVTVGGSALSSGNMTFTFTGTLAGTDTSLIVLTSSLTGGGSAPITQTTQGVCGYVANTSLQSSWSDFMRTGDQTDTGTFQLWALVYTDANANECRVRASIAIGDTGTAVINRAASVPATTAPIWVNLGPVHAKKRISSGSYRWTAAIGAMTVGTVGTDCRILKLAKLPVDSGVAVAKTPQNTTQTLVASDDFNQTAGALSGKTADLGGSWSGAGDADDFTVDATNHRIQRTAVSDTGGVGRCSTVGGSYDAASASVSVLASSLSGQRQGVLLRFDDALNFAAVTLKMDASPKLQFTKVIGGSRTDLTLATFYGWMSPGGGWSFSARITFAAGADGYVSASLGGAPTTFFDSDLLVSGPLGAGNVGLYDEQGNGTACTRAYDDFSAYQIADATAAAFASRGLAWQPDGSLETEAAAGTYFGQTPGVQRAGIPLLDPSGTNRLLIASADCNPDVAGSRSPAPSLGYTVEHRPAFAIGRH